MALFNRCIQMMAFVIVSAGIGCTTNVYNTYATEQTADTGTLPTNQPTSDAATESDSAPRNDAAQEAASDTGVAADAAQDAAMTPDTAPTPETKGTETVDAGTPDTAPPPPPPVATDSGAPETSSAPETGTVTPPPPPPAPAMSILTIHVRIPQWGSHTVALWDFVNVSGVAAKTVTGNGVDYTAPPMATGSKLVINGTIDGSWAFADYVTGKPLVAAWATVDGKPAGRVTTQRNSLGNAYDLVFTATPATVAPDDMDGDGFTTADPKSLIFDCNDNPSDDGGSTYPGQVEVPGDSRDFDCNHFNDPPRWFIEMTGPSIGFTPQLTDVPHWPSTYSLSWRSTVSGGGAYDSPLFSLDLLPTEFYVSWGSPLVYDASSVSGVCVESASFRAYNDQDATSYRYDPAWDPGSKSCHHRIVK